MSSSNAPRGPICVYCRQDAKLVCNGCNEAPGIDGKVVAKMWYCGAVRQRSHWKTHKELCKPHQARKTLYRAGAMAQLAFYLYREKIFDRLIAKTEKKHNSLYLYEGYYGATQFLVPFPKDLFPDENDKLAVLTYLSSTDAIAYMLEMIEWMVKDIYSGIEEIGIKSKNHKCQLFNIHVLGGKDPTDYSHKVYRVTTKNGETYAIDLAGSQYGCYEAVTPWDNFIASRAREIESVKNFGYHKAMVQGDGMCNEFTHFGLIFSLNRIHSKAFNDGLRMFQEEHITLNAMLRLPEHDYHHKQVQLLNYMDQYMKGFGEFIEEKEGFYGISGSKL